MALLTWRAPVTPTTTGRNGGTQQRFHKAANRWTESPQSLSQQKWFIDEVPSLKGEFIHVLPSPADCIQLNYTTYSWPLGQAVSRHISLVAGRRADPPQLCNHRPTFGSLVVRGVLLLPETKDATNPSSRYIGLGTNCPTKANRNFSPICTRVCVCVETAIASGNLRDV